MVVIRLARFGSAHSPRYRIAVADQRRYRDSKFLEIIGFYNPDASGKAEKLKIDVDKVNEWVKKGAQPSDRVKSLLRLANQKV